MFRVAVRGALRRGKAQHSREGDDMQSYRHASAATPGWLVMLVGATIAGPAIAQQLEEIVVTAERRELSLQETPISVLAFTGESLEMRGVRDLFDLANL